jgi:hypothetical protein
VSEIYDGSPVWYWCEVAYRLWENNMIRESVLRDAEEIDVINSVLEMEYQRKTRPDLTAEVVRAVQP